MTREDQMAAALARLEKTDEDDGDVRRPRLPQGAGQVYSVRIPVEALERLRRVASASGSAPSALIRQWVLERLDEESPRRRITIHPAARAVPNRAFAQGDRRLVNL